MTMFQLESFKILEVPNEINDDGKVLRGQGMGWQTFFSNVACE